MGAADAFAAAPRASRLQDALETAGAIVYPRRRDCGPRGEPAIPAMSETKASTDKPAKADKPAKSDASEGAAGASKAGSGSGGTTRGKSARESVGGAKEVHYGYFSNVRSDEYRAGWDAIWGDGERREPSPAATRRRARRKPAPPIRLHLDVDDLPADLRAGLADLARARLKASRVNYDKREAAGAVDWQIECRVRRT